MSRFTIRTLMYLVAGVAVLCWVGLTWGFWLVFMFLFPLGLGWLAWFATWGRQRRAGWLLAGLTGLTAALSALLCVYPLPLVGPALSWMVVLLTLPALGVCGVAWLIPPAGHEVGWRVIGRSILMGGLILTPLSMAATSWPLAVAFRLVRPEFIRLADRVASGQPVTFPRDVGPYTIRAIRVAPDRSGNVALFLDTDPSGPIAFVRVVDWSTYQRPDLGIVPSDYQIPLGDGWSYMVED